MNPRFGLLHTGPWPYHECEGVGIRLVASRSFPLAEVVATFFAHGCPQDLAYRVADELKQNGTRTTTVLTTVLFDTLARRLMDFGIGLEIVPPRGSGGKDWK